MILLKMAAIEEYNKTRQILFEKEGFHPKSRIVSINGPVRNVHYLEIGTGQPLLLIHGGGSHSSEFINILKPLSLHYHLFVIDRPGHGLTDAFNYGKVDMRKHAVDFIGAYMDAVGLEKASLVGHSMGGYFSLCFALEFPNRVGKLLLLGAPASVNRWIPPMLRLLAIKRLNWILIKTFAKPNLRNLKTIYKNILVAHPQKLSEAYYNHCIAGQKLPGFIQGFTTLLENVLTLEGWREELYLGDQLHSLDVPLRIIWGRKDAFENPETGLEKASGVPNLQFEIVEEAGHAVWLDQPEECVALIVQMLRT